MGTAQVVVTVDIAVFRETVQGVEILLIQRKKQPYAGQWALPGGKLDEQDATLADAVFRECWEETGVVLSCINQVAAYGDRKRDPRGRYVSVLYIASFDVSFPLQPGSDALDAQWFPVTSLPAPLAFDHGRLASDAIEYVSRPC